MIQAVFLALLLSLPLSAEAAFRITLKNGSVLSGVSSYEKSDGQVLIFYGSGAVGVPESDILKIEEVDAPARDLTVHAPPDSPDAAPETGRAPTAFTGDSPASEGSTEDKSARESALRSELDAISSEIRSLEAEEARLAAEVNQKNSSRTTWNYYQMQQLQRETEPMRQEMSSVQLRKSELIQRKSALESELRSLQ